MIAHVGGLPVEEFLPALAGLGTGGLLVVRSRLTMLIRRRKEDEK